MYLDFGLKGGPPPVQHIDVCRFCFQHMDVCRFCLAFVVGGVLANSSWLAST